MSKRRAIFSIHYRYAGRLRDDPPRRHEIAFSRYEPNHTDGERSRIYRSFTVASAGRAQRLLEGGRMWWAEDRGGGYRNFRPQPWELPRETVLAAEVDTQ